MQCESDAIKMQERAWGKNPGTMPTYLSRPCRTNSSGSGSGTGTDSEAEVEGGGGGERSRPRRIEQSVSEASLAPPT